MAYRKKSSEVAQAATGLAPTVEVRTPWAESKEAYLKVKATLYGEVFQDWTHARFIAHWRRLRDDPNSLPIAHSLAIQALHNLGHIEREREPGEDDE